MAALIRNHSRAAFVITAMLIAAIVGYFGTPGHIAVLAIGFLLGYAGKVIYGRGE